MGDSHFDQPGAWDKGFELEVSENKKLFKK